MAYLTTFYWGWLLGSVLLGFAMGWISVSYTHLTLPTILRV